MLGAGLKRLCQCTDSNHGDWTAQIIGLAGHDITLCLASQLHDSSIGPSCNNPHCTVSVINLNIMMPLIIWPCLMKGDAKKKESNDRGRDTIITVGVDRYSECNSDSDRDRRGVLENKM